MKRGINVADDACLGASTTFYDEQAPLYRTFRNRELLEVVQGVLPAGGRVLDVGCAAGGLLAHLKGAASHRVGLELSQSGTAEAEGVADEIVRGSIEDPAVDFPEGSFDVVVCADVLEHLPEPARALSRAVRWTAPGGAVVVSVPNIANWQARLRLLRGVWRYESCGIWDGGHLRFFTLDTLCSLVGSCGLAVESVRGTQALRHQVKLFRWAPNRVLRPVENMVRRLATRQPQLLAYQLIVVARKP